MQNLHRSHAHDHVCKICTSVVCVSWLYLAVVCEREVLVIIDTMYPIWYNSACLAKTIPGRECVVCLIVNHTRKGAVCRRS